MMPVLTKDAILADLKLRFDGEVVYTYVGDIVVSLNPFKNVGCVGKAIRARYKLTLQSSAVPELSRTCTVRVVATSKSKHTFVLGFLG